jgi:hypothetical protein
MMRIAAAEHEKMLAVRLCGPRVIARLEAIGVMQLQDLAQRDPYQLVHEINIAAGRPIWHPPIATQAMTNLIAAARQEPNADTACVRLAVTGTSTEGTKRHEHRKRTEPAPCSHLSASINMPATWAPQRAESSHLGRDRFRAPAATERASALAATRERRGRPRCS